jgi:hypothetical protein
MIYLVDPKYNPNHQSAISSSTKLGPGITCAKFLGSAGTRTQFEQIEVDRAQVARQLYLHAEAMLMVNKNNNFSSHRLIVAEGVYRPTLKETVTPNSINDLKKTGRAVVYQLINKKGAIDLRKSFDLAVYWKDYLKFDKLVLDYDTFDPSNKLSCQVVLAMPSVPASFDISFKQKIETTYNGKLQSKNELIEILPA